MTIAIHGGREIGGPVYRQMLRQLGITVEEFRRLI